MAAHVTFGEGEQDLKKGHDGSGGNHREAAQLHGIYNMRNRSSMVSLRRTVSNDGAEDDDAGLRQASDYKQKQVFKGTQLLILAYQSIGVIYGDIGTSPLYVYSGIFSDVPSNPDLVGALSLIIWSLIMMVTVKYILIILNADNEGEGGTFSTYSLLSRYAHITERDPREASLIKMERHRTNEFSRTSRGFRSFLERNSVAKILLKIMGVLAVTMVMSDGVLTPAQSVLGAVQGLDVIAPSITNGTVVGVTCAILILLFLIQPLGTNKIAHAFAPIVIIWLAWNAIFGIYNLANHDWTVLRAFNPGFAFEFLIRNKEHGWRQLGGVLLSFTGVEALFADLGAFSKHAIQISWLCYTLPCLLLAYIGQAAFISQNPEAYSNPFYNAAPPGTLIPSLIIAILAAVVASQAIITATFQLMAQIMKLSYFPQIKVVHTSTTHHGQLYVPVLNWLLMIGTVLVAAIYNNTTSLGNAYGVCVMFVTFFDTCMVSLAAILVWKIHPAIVFLPWLTIAAMDGAFLSSALTKVPDGAWFTLTLAAVLASLLILWRFGKENQWRAEAADRFPTSYLVKKDRYGDVRLTDTFGGGSLSPIKGFGIFFDKAGEKTPIVFTNFISKLAAIPDVTVFFHLRPLETPSVPPEQRYTVSRLAIPHCYRLVVRHGYMDEVITPNLGALVAEQVRDFIIRNGSSRVTIARSILEGSSVRDSAEVIDGREVITSAPAEGKQQHDSGEKTLEAPVIAAASSSNSTTADSEPQQRQQQQQQASDPEKTHQVVASNIPARFASALAGSETGGASQDFDDDGDGDVEGMAVELRRLEEAYGRQTLYIVGKEQLFISREANLVRRLILGTYLWLRDNTRTKIANLRVPTDKLVEVGFVKAM